MNIENIVFVLLFISIPYATCRDVFANMQDPICFIQGECTNSTLLDLDFFQSENECLKFCQENEACTWFSFDFETKSCGIFENCSNLSSDDCPECVSGM